MLTDKILGYGMYSALVAFLLTTSLIFISSNDILYVSLAALSLYLFIGVAWVNQSRKNGINSSQTTKEVAMIILGTVLLIVIIAIMMKVWEGLQVI